MKRSSLRLLKRLGLIGVARTLQRTRAVIVTYHGVLPAESESDDFLDHNFPSAEIFEQQLQYVREHYRPIALTDLVECYRRGKQPPPRSVAFTFDDGFANNYTVALPLLRRYSIPVTIFVTTGLVGQSDGQLWTERVARAVYLYPSSAARLPLNGAEIVCDLSSGPKRASAARRVVQLLKSQPLAQRDAALHAIEGVCGRPLPSPHEMERYRFLTWSQVREMASLGVEIGSHTVNHPILSRLDEDTMRTELVASKHQIEFELRRQCSTFAYPNGAATDFGAREKKALREAGYVAAFSLAGRLNGPGPDLYELSRINIGRHPDVVYFEAAVSGILPLGRRLRNTLVNSIARRPAVAEEVGA